MFSNLSLQELINKVGSLRYWNLPAILKEVLTRIVAIPSYELPYKTYIAIIEQEGTNAPVVTVLENTLGLDIVWSYNMTGTYFGTVDSATFSMDNTYCTVTANFNGKSLIGVHDSTKIKLQSLNTSFVNINNAFYLDMVEIRVYI